MVVLGLAVGDGSTRLDDLVTAAGGPRARWLLVFTDPLLLQVLLAVAVGWALYRRRWRVAVVMVVTPVVAVLAVRVLTRLFGRYRGDSLAYPGGHVTVAVVVLGMVLLVVGARVWPSVVAAVVALLGVVGQSLTYHYFTDTVGAVLLATALVCLAATAAGLDRCQPRCDLRHSGG